MLDSRSDYECWVCVMCRQDFIDPEDYPEAEPEEMEQIEPRLYWLSPTEVICHRCASLAGIPPIDE